MCGIVFVILYLITLRTDINVRSGINVRAGNMGENNKRKVSNKHTGGNIYSLGLGK